MNQRIEQILHSADSAQPATPRHFLLAAIEQKIADRLPARKTIPLRTISAAAAGLLLLLALNIALLSRQPAGKQEGMQSVARFYNLDKDQLLGI